MSALTSPSRPTFFAARIVGLGLLWGVLMIIVESFTVPIGDMGVPMIASFVMLIGVPWCLTGVILAAASLMLEPHLPVHMLAVGLIGFAVLAAAINLGIADLTNRANLDLALRALFHRPRSSLTVFLYDFWEVCFYGGLFATALVLSARIERSRAQIASLQIWIDRNEAAVDQERLIDMNGGLPQSFLLEAVAGLQRLYDDANPAAEDLMSDLVAFFRTANAGLISGGITLADELALAEAYGRVRRHLQNGPQVRFDIAPDVPDLPLSGHMLVPMIDQLAREGAAVTVTGSWMDGVWCLGLAADRPVRQWPRDWESRFAPLVAAQTGVAINSQSTASRLDLRIAGISLAFYERTQHV